MLASPRHALSWRQTPSSNGDCVGSVDTEIGLCSDKAMMAQTEEDGDGEDSCWGRTRVEVGFVSSCRRREQRADSS
jgi:hypothetical protein